MKTLICMICVIIFCVFAPGCTIHFKGENLELDAERQRVFHFDGVTFTEFAKTYLRGPAKLYRIQKVEILRSKIMDKYPPENKFVFR